MLSWSKGTWQTLIKALVRAGEPPKINTLPVFFIWKGFSKMLWMRSVVVQNSKCFSRHCSTSEDVCWPNKSNFSLSLFFFKPDDFKQLFLHHFFLHSYGKYFISTKSPSNYWAHCSAVKTPKATSTKRLPAFCVRKSMQTAPKIVLTIHRGHTNVKSGQCGEVRVAAGLRQTR